MTSGCILNLQRFSTEDGPGIRTTVFFQGCPLRCRWCHNPESLSQEPQIQWHANRCLGCQICLDTCPHGCLEVEDHALTVDRTRCRGCGECAAACPSGALEAMGRRVSVDELTRELLKDRVYYEKSGGGVTLSGGEPAMQAEFAEATLRGLRMQGIATALDTCGFCAPDVLDRFLPYTDLVLFDLKLLDAEEHRELTGQSNAIILANLLRIRDYRPRPGRTIGLWIRTPLVPGVTALEPNLREVGRFIHDHLNGVVSRWELCAFNNLCREQYRRLGMDWPYADTRLMTADELAECGRIARQSGAPPEIVWISGATRVPADT